MCLEKLKNRLKEDMVTGFKKQAEERDSNWKVSPIRDVGVLKDLKKPASNRQLCQNYVQSPNNVIVPNHLQCFSEAYPDQQLMMF